MDRTELLRDELFLGRRQVCGARLGKGRRHRSVLYDRQHIGDQNRIDDFLAHVSTLPRLFVPVAVSQSIPAGTLVPKGTPVDIVLVPMSNIHFGLFDQTHADLAVHPVTDVLPIIQDAAVAPALAKSSAADLTPAEKQLITQKLSSIHVAIDDTNPA